MALVQIRYLLGGRVIWAKLSQAAKLVAQGSAEYIVDTAPPALETAMLAPPENAAARTGRAPARRPGKR